MPTPDSRFATTRPLDVGQQSNGVRDRRSSRAGALRGRSTASRSLRRAGDASPRKKCCWSPNSVPAVSAAKTAGIGDPDVLARTITVYTDVGTFQRFLSIPGSNDVHALVVDRDRTILARGCGDSDDQSWPAIAAGLLVA